MLRTTCPNVMETECQPAVCKSAHQRTVICLAFSSFPASLLTLLKIRRSLTHRALDEVIPLIPEIDPRSTRYPPPFLRRFELLSVTQT